MTLQRLPLTVGSSPTFGKFGLVEVYARLSLWHSRFLTAMQNGMREWAAKVQSEMRANARWEDRTGHARGALVAYLNLDAPGDRPSYADVENPAITPPLNKDDYVVIVTGLMHYSVYLETRWGGKFAIVWPTVVANNESFMKILFSHGKAVTNG